MATKSEIPSNTVNQLELQP